MQCFLCLPRNITQRLAAINYQFEEADAWLDLWCHTVSNDRRNVFSFMAPAVQYGKYGAILTLETLGQRWGWEKTKVWRFFQKHGDVFALYRLPGSYGCLIFNKLYPCDTEVSLPTQEAVVRILEEIRILARNTRKRGTDHEHMHKQMLVDLKTAEKFIFMDYFIIEEGIFWNSILDILKEKAAIGVEVRVIYDDIGCMMTLPGNYDKILHGFGIDAVPFSKLKGNADSEFNNRSHRKIAVIDGRIGYTGGVNIADEYINEKVVYGHWKDVGLRLEGEAVRELTRLFLVDYGINVRKLPAEKQDYFPEYSVQSEGYLIPFGDGPKPIFDRRVGKTVIENMLNHATRYFYAMTPYLILDEALCQAVENAALRGVKVKLILPGVPDKWIVKELACSHYERLMKAGVEIYEYEPGFVHAKVYLADDETAMVGTINMDHRSLVHNFENGVWMYRCDCIKSIKADFYDTFAKCIRIDESKTNWHWLRRFIRSAAKVFAPLM